MTFSQIWLGHWCILTALWLFFLMAKIVVSSFIKPASPISIKLIPFLAFMAVLALFSSGGHYFILKLLAH